MTDLTLPSGPSAAADRIEHYCVVLTRPIAFIGVLGMLIAAGVTVIDVLMRWLIGTAITALNEITAMVFAVAVAACIPAGLAGGVNLKIDILARWLTGRVAAFLDAFGAFLLLVFFSTLTWRIAIFADSLMRQGRTTVILGWPEAPFMVTTAFLLGIGSLIQAVVTARAIERAWARVRDDAATESTLVTAIVLVIAA